MISQREARHLAAGALRAHGLPGRPKALKWRSAPAQAQLFTAGNLLLKVYAPDARARGQRQASRQQEVASALAQGSFRAPPVTFFDGQTLTMPRIAGPDLATLWRDGDPTVPTLAGLWLRAFHDLSQHRFPFQPMPHVKWLRHVAGQVEKQDRPVIDPKAFTSACAEAMNQAHALRGQPSTRAIIHRDMTLANLLYDGSVTWGIDFENTSEDAPLRDLFTLALDFVTLCRRNGSDDDRALTDLRAAYGDNRTAPRVREFLTICYALHVWANTPLAPTPIHHARLVTVRRLLATGEQLI